MGYIAGRYAALDIGTVTCRLLVADVGAAGEVSVLAKRYAITNLGQGVDATGRLSEEAMGRVRATVASYMETLAALQAETGVPAKLTAVATSAARDAENADEFRAMLAGLGVTLAVIPGQREAALSFLGAGSAFAGEPVVVVDIGGGSTEVVGGIAGADPQLARSFDIGCRRVTERLLHADPPAPDELAAARQWTYGQFAPYFQKLRDAGLGGARLVAVAGTATTVVSVRDAMEVYDSARVHKSQVTRSQLDEVYRRFASVPLDGRRTIVGLDPDRAPVIVAGMVILQEVMEAAGADSFTVSESDILEGIVLNAAAGFPSGGCD